MKHVRNVVAALALSIGFMATTPSHAATPERFGAQISSKESVALSTILKDPKAYSGKTVVVEGKARKICKVKGCWMELATSMDAKAPGCRVSFKDYAFFVPKDAAGSRVRVQATIQTKKLSKEEVDHLESDGASFQSKNSDGSATEVSLVATAVELTRPASKN